MPSAKVTVSIDERLLREVDRWVAAGDFPSRSRALQAGLISLRERRERRRLLRELAKLDPSQEQRLAEETPAAELAWPKY